MLRGKGGLTYVVPVAAALLQQPGSRLIPIDGPAVAYNLAKFWATSPMAVTFGSVPFQQIWRRKAVPRA